MTYPPSLCPFAEGATTTECGTNEATGGRDMGTITAERREACEAVARRYAARLKGASSRQWAEHCIISASVRRAGAVSGSEPIALPVGISERRAQAIYSRIECIFG